METLIQDAKRIDEQLSKHQMELLSMLSGYDEEAEAFEARLGESRHVLESIRAESDDSNMEHWKQTSLGFLDELELFTHAVKRDLLNDRVTLFGFAVQLYSAGGVLRMGTFAPSSGERRQYVQKLVTNLVGLAPGFGDALSLMDIGKTILEWRNHKLKFAEGVQRTVKLLEYYSLVDWFKQEGLSSTEELISRWRNEAGQHGSALSVLDHHLRDWFSNVADRDPRFKDLLARWNAPNGKSTS